MAIMISPGKQIVLGAALISLITAIVYTPALSGNFLLDDNQLITDNPLVHASNGLYRFWCTTDAADYWPLTNSSFWLEWRLWDVNPAGYHVTNLLLHLASVFLLWGILRQLAIPGAFLAALLFAVHPVNVESVAWISQRKNTLAIVFFLLSIVCYLRAESRPQMNRGALWYGLSFLAFLLAMLSKGSAVVLPLAVLLLIGWQRRRIQRADFVRMVPFFLAAILLGAVNVWFQTHGLDDTIRSVTFPERLAGAGAAVWFYLAKSWWPLDLLFVYPQWRVAAQGLLWWLPLWALLVCTAILWRQRRTRYGRALLFAWAFFCAALVPVLGFADVGYMQFSLVADHYQHIAIIAVVAILAAGLTRWRRTAVGSARIAALLVSAIVVVFLAALAWERNTLFRSAASLYAATLESNPDCWQLRNSLAAVLNQAGKHAEAAQQSQQALRLNPESADAHFNLAVALGETQRIAEANEHFQQAVKLRPDRAAEVESALASILITASRLDEAIELCHKALERNPDDADAFKNLGIAQLGQGQTSPAIESFREALRREPYDGETWNNLAVALVAAGQSQEALECYQRAVQLHFDSPQTRYSLGNLLVAAGKPEIAIQHYQQAIALQPNDAAIEGNLGAALVQLHRPIEAIAHLERAVQLGPASSQAHSNLGIALFSVGKTPQSIARFQKALELNPENAAARFNLGIALKQAGRLQEATDEFERCLQQAPDNSAVYEELMTVCVRLKQPEKAIAAIQKGLALARSNHQTAFARQLEAWLEYLRAQGAVSPNGAGTSAEKSTP